MLSFAIHTARGQQLVGLIFHNPRLSSVAPHANEVPKIREDRYECLLQTTQLQVKASQLHADKHCQVIRELSFADLEIIFVFPSPLKDNMELERCRYYVAMVGFVSCPESIDLIFINYEVILCQLTQKVQSSIATQLISGRQAP